MAGKWSITGRTNIRLRDPKGRVLAVDHGGYPRGEALPVFRRIVELLNEAEEEQLTLWHVNKMEGGDER